MLSVGKHIFSTVYHQLIHEAVQAVCAFVIAIVAGVGAEHSEDVLNSDIAKLEDTNYTSNYNQSALYDDAYKNNFIIHPEWKIWTLDPDKHIAYFTWKGVE